MCLGVPGRIVDVYEAGGIRMGRIDFGGVVKDACLAYVPDAGVGEWALIHVGFAIGRIDEAEAQRSLEILRSDGLTALELGPPPGDAP